MLLFVETDHTFPKESRRRAEDILEEVKATYHVQIFSGVAHGFGTRGDPEVENSRMFLLAFVKFLGLSLIAV
jgi:dienelactone hydrolase